MRKFFKISLVSIFIFFLSLTTFSTTWLVNVADFSFTPSNLPNVLVGDTVKWQWQNGFHTTTSQVIPPGAAVWDSPLNSGSQVFIYIVTQPGSYNYVCTPHAPNMAGQFTANIIGITPIHGEVPSVFRLEQNYPNPFNPVTEILFDIPEETFVKLTVMNLIGQEVEILSNGKLAAGRYSADWNASNYPSGIYFYRLDAGSFSQTRKMILVK